jgi:hypothetical protein
MQIAAGYDCTSCSISKLDLLPLWQLAPLRRRLLRSLLLFLLGRASLLRPSSPPRRPFGAIACSAV